MDRPVKMTSSTRMTKRPSTSKSISVVRTTADGPIWTWIATDTAFWNGAFNGMALDSAYTNWAAGQPMLVQNFCIVMRIDGHDWLSQLCSAPAAYVCEAQ